MVGGKISKKCFLLPFGVTDWLVGYILEGDTN